MSKSNRKGSIRKSKKYRIFNETPESIRSININSGDFMYCTFSEKTDEEMKELIISDDELMREIKVLDNKNHREKDIRDIINFTIEKKNELCTGIKGLYLHESIMDSDIILTIRRNRKNNINKRTNSKVLGFVLLTPNYFPLKTLHIDLICSSQKLKGGGDILINMVEKIAKTLYLDSITLTSYKHKKVIGFYEKHDFIKEMSDCMTNDEPCNMEKKLKYKN